MESYVFYRSFHEALEILSDEQFGHFMRMLNEYALNGVEPTIEDPFMAMAFKLIKPQIDANFQRKENGRKGAVYGKLGGRPKKETSDEEIKVEEPGPTEEKTDAEEPKPQKKKSTRFQKPTVEEVDAYIKEKRFGFSAAKFIDYYESKGWVVGKSPMKDWKAACNTWERNNQNFSPHGEVSRDSEQMDEYENFFRKKDG